MSKNTCIVKFYNNKNSNIKINIKKIAFENNNIIFKNLTLFDLKNILHIEHKINLENKIFTCNGIMLDNNYELQINHVILVIDNEYNIFNLSNNKINQNKIDINQYNDELKYLKIYPEIIPFIYLIKESPIYLESFLVELKNRKSILYNIIKKNEELFINLFKIPDDIINKLIEHSLKFNKDQNSDEESSSDDYNTMLSSNEIIELDNSDEINEHNSIILDLNDNNENIDEICLLFPNVNKNDIINYYNIFNFDKENVINFIYENYEI